MPRVAPRRSTLREGAERLGRRPYGLSLVVLQLFVTTPDRTLFQYLTKPLRAFADRAMREP